MLPACVFVSVNIWHEYAPRKDSPGAHTCLAQVANDFKGIDHLDSAIPCRFLPAKICASSVHLCVQTHARKLQTYKTWTEIVSMTPTGLWMSPFSLAITIEYCLGVNVQRVLSSRAQRLIGVRFGPAASHAITRHGHNLLPPRWSNSERIDLWPAEDTCVETSSCCASLASAGAARRAVCGPHDVQAPVPTDSALQLS